MAPRESSSIEMELIGLGDDDGAAQGAPPRSPRTGEETQQLLLLPSDPPPSSSTAAVRSRTPFRSLEGGRAEAGAAASSLDDELDGGDDDEGSKAVRWTRGHHATTRHNIPRRLLLSPRLFLLLLPIAGGLLAALSTVHVLFLRRAAASRLGSVLAIIGSAEYFPLEQYGLHHATLATGGPGARQRSLLVEDEEEEWSEGRALEVDGGGRVALAPPEQEQQPPVEGDGTPVVHRMAVGVITRPLGPLQPGALVGTRGAPTSVAAQAPAAGGRPTCALTYLMNVTEPEARSMDVDEYDRQLLGTIMVRLCDCGCARDRGLLLGGGGGPPLQPLPDGSLRLMSEILRGAHVVVEGDKGAFYSWLTQMQDSYQRTSSHASSAPMYGIDEGSVLRTVLTGRDAGGNTWLQFEGAGWNPFRRPRESFIHMVNYVQYKLTNRQVGPLGVSEYTDSNPIRLRFDGCLGALSPPPPLQGASIEGESRVLSFRQYEPSDPTGKGVRPSHRRWDEMLAPNRRLLASCSFLWRGKEGGKAEKEEEGTGVWVPGGLRRGRRSSIAA